MVLTPTKSELTYHSMVNENEEIITPDEETDEEALEESYEEESEEDDEEPEDTKPKLTKEQKLARAQAMVKRYSPKEDKVQIQPKEKEVTKDTPLSREEAILYARGLTVEDVEDAQFISDKDGISLLSATESSRFKALKKDRDDEVKNSAAQLRASRGSKAQTKVSFSDSGLDKDTHKQLWKEKTGQ